MNPQVMMYILYGLFGFIVLIAFLTGIRRGLRKSVYWLITLVIYLVLLFSTLGVSSRLIYSIALDKNITGILVDVMGVEQDIASNPVILDQISMLGQAIIKIAYTIVLWIIIYFVSWILWLSVFKRKLMEAKMTKEERKQFKKDKKRKKGETRTAYELRMTDLEEKYPEPKKKRLLGGLVGFGRGLMSSFMILCMLNGLVAIIPEINRPQESASTESNNYEDVFYKFLVNEAPFLDTVLDYVETYKDSTLNKVTKLSIQGKTVDLIFTDSFLSGSYKNQNGQKVVLNIMEEIKNLVLIASKACELTNGFDMNSVNFMALTPRQQQLTSEILRLIANDSFIMGSIPAVITYGLMNDDISKELEKLGIDKNTFKKANWSNDIKIISSIVDDVYSLSETNDLTKIDYLNMDTTKVESILKAISKLSVIQPGLEIATNQLLSSKDFQEVIGDTQVDFSDVVWSDEIVNIGKIYSDFIDTGINTILDSSKNEDGKINVLQALTSLKADGHDAATRLIDSIFNSVFVEKVVPIALKMATDSIEDESLKEMINFDVVGKDGWTNELSTVLQLIKEVSHTGESVYTKFDFKMINDISVETLLKSKLLENAAIHLLVGAANNEGLLQGDVSNYIDLPVEFKQQGDLTGINNPDWKDTISESGQIIKEGELRKALTPLKNILSQIESFDDILGSLEPMIKSLDDSMMDSNLIYYSLNKILPTLTEDNILAIPTSVYTTENLIDKAEMKNLVGSLKQFPISKLLGKKVVEENQDESNEPVEEKRSQQEENTKTVFVANVDSIMEAIMSIENLDAFFDSKILSTTVSYYVDEYASDFLVLPETAYTNEEIKQADDTTKTIKSINKNELTNLVSTLSKLTYEDNHIDITAIGENPGEIVKYISTETANDVFMENSQEYSMILHSTISKFLMDLENEGAIVIPSSSKENELVKGKDIIAIIKAAKTLDIEDFNTISDDPMAIIEDDSFTKEKSESLFLENGDSYSNILHATLSKYLIEATENSDLVLPPSVIDSKENIVDGQELVSLIEIAKVLDIDIENMDLSSLSISLIDENKDTIVDSFIIKATTTKFVVDAKLIDIPAQVYDTFKQDDLLENNTSYYFKESEIKALISSLTALNITNFSDVETLSISSIEVSDIVDSKETLKQSTLIRKMVTDEVQTAFGNEALAIDAVDDNAILKDEEFDALLSSLEILNITSLDQGIDINSITLDTLKTNDYSILDSKLIWNKVSEEIKSLASAEIIVPGELYENTLYNRIPISEIKNMINSITLLGVNDLSSVNFDFENNEHLSVNNFATNIDTLILSKVVHASISNQIANMNNENIIIPDGVNTVDSIFTNSSNLYVDANELKNLFKALQALEINSITSTQLDSFSHLTVDKLSDTIDELLQSKILHYTISDKVISQDEIAKGNTLETSKTIYVSALEDLVKALKLLNVNDFNHIDAEEIITHVLSDVSEEHLDVIFSSEIIELTASNNVRTHFAESDSLFHLPENQVIYNSDHSEYLVIDYVNHDIEKEEMIHLINSSKILGFTNLDSAVNNFTFDDFLNQGLDHDEIMVVLSSKINSYNIGLQIQAENEEDGSFNGLLVFHEDVDWYTNLHIGDEYIEGDLHPLIHSLMQIKADDEVSPVFDSLTSDDGDDTINNQTDAVYAKLADYLAHGRILINTIPAISQKFLNEYDGTVINKDHITIPQDKGEDYWRGTTNDIKDGELYKFLVAINRLTHYETYQTQQELEEAIHSIRKSEIVRDFFDQDALFNSTIVSTINMYRNMHAQSSLPNKEEVVSVEEYNSYISEYSKTLIEIRNSTI